MGIYTTRPITQDEYRILVKTVNDGYTDNNIVHKPNPRLATIMILERNMGLRLSDIIKLKREDIFHDGTGYRLDIVEKKTKNKRYLRVDDAVKHYLDSYCDSIGVTAGRIFTITDKAVWKALREVTSYLKLQKVNTHSIRKLAGITIYKETKHDIEAVREFYGHSSIDMTKRYIEQTPETLSNAIHNTVDIPI